VNGEAIHITSIHYLRKGAFWDFEVPGPNNYELAGCWSHNSGKTTACSFEVARAARGEHPYYGKKPLDIYIVVDKEDHIGRVIYDKLFRASSDTFIIKDEITGNWRVYVPDTDAHRKKERKPYPPLIPPRLIDGRPSWYKKGSRAFHVIRLKPLDPSWSRGTEIWAFSGVGSAPQGQGVDLVWIDEDLRDPDFVNEMVMRCPSKNGRIIWSAFPHNSNDALINASEMAADQKGEEHPVVEEFLMSTVDNKYMDQNELKNSLTMMKQSPEEMRARIYGEFLNDSVLMYPSLNKEVHCVPREFNYHLIDTVLREGVIPDNWTRYLAIDPGFSTAFVVALAVSHPNVGEYVVVYDELELHSCTADKLARSIKERWGEQNFEAFIIDDHGSNQRNAGSGQTIRSQYRAAFEKHRVLSHRSGSGFITGSSDRAGRASLVRTWLQSDPHTGTPKLLFLKDKTPLLLHNLSRYKKWLKKERSEDVADPASKYSHGPNALEYGVMFQPQWVKPERTERKTAAYLEYEELNRWMKRGQNDASIILGPGSSN
jgi:hypothetical protein